MTNPYPDLQKLINSEVNKANTHGLLLAVQSGDNHIDFRGGAGAQTDAPFFVASVTKMFTATLILQIIDQGLIKLDTNVQSILTQYDLSDIHVVKGHSYGMHLTIRHLLHQTSGLADYYENQIANALKLGKDRAYDLADVMRMTKALPPQGRPDIGRSYYSDTNWQLLGAIVEALTGRSFSDVVQTQICVPLGMRQTSVFAHSQVGTPTPLALYHKSKALHVPLALSSMGPDGGVVSTLDDMLLFLRAYMGNTLFDPKNQKDVRQFQKLFFPLEYGLGLMRFKLPRWMNLFRETPEFIGHSGASGSFAFYAPKNDVYLTGTFNQLDAPQRPFGFMIQVMQVLDQHKAVG